MTVTTTDVEAQMYAALEHGDLPYFEELAALLDARAQQRRQRLAEPAALASTAAWYAEQNIPIFPVEPRGKVPMPGLRWREKATTNPAQIGAWWRAWPQANIGMPTGVRWNVIDIDGPVGYQSFGLMREEGLLPPILGRVRTPRPGMHIYVPADGGNNAAGFRPGLDYRGDGGYVVLPPSWGANGEQYEWLDIPPVAP